MSKSERKKEMVEVIEEHELVEVRAMRAQLTELRKQVRQGEEHLAGLESNLIASLARGAVVKGRLTANIEKKMGDCRPKWKDEHLNHMEAVHGEAREAVEAALRLEYPPEPKDVLVIGESK